MLTLLKIFLVALIGSLLLTPMVRRLALRLGMVDVPDQHRKLHNGPVPLGGGIAVVGGCCLALAVAFALSARWRERFLDESVSLAGLFLATLVICGLGLLDDRFRLRGRQKLAGQVLAGVIVLSTGLVIQQVTVFDWRIELGLLAVPFTLFWILGATNALNLIDGVDGLATSVGIVLSVAVSIMALLAGHMTDAILAMAVAGGLAGFLVYNAPPASIFLGDAGSMFVGLLLGTLAIRSSLKGPATIALAAPAALLAIPILDVAMAILRRKLTGRSIYATDRGHLHHRLIGRGYGAGRTVVTIGLLCSLTAVAAVFSEYSQNDVMAVAAVIAVVAVLAISRLFGDREFVLLLRRLKQLVASLIPRWNRREQRSGVLQARIQSSGQWDELWETLTTFAERFDLNDIQLNVHLPAQDEEYHASWQRKERPRDAEIWRSEIPLIANDITVGRLRITGQCSNCSVCAWMGDLIAGLKPFETHMLELIDAVAEPEDVANLLPTVSTRHQPDAVPASRESA
ncbi:MAG: undecaprenyl/decaprenyl-phosphate alpha-N-acetylglucosaminyl 1-phosphate transferase [Planctomycetes bacterium]|nr:undecaprenyl/decaprenyl-phosphate alpha-N-acetylglucosaminyl 1-phosphate transferase [Planctomycetota bacterium]MBL7043151.1 undecaprenyl/decaprenyl-phosphate alpha-N-acetylglucosaminyl 1-phosphate transferase [Pirellulaceae bacterium]